jgi:hypothetical protein
VNPRPWVPFGPYEGRVEVPPLPFKPRVDSLLEMYKISTHFIPAANTRVTPESPFPRLPVRPSKRTEKDIKNLGLELIEHQAHQAEDGRYEVTTEKLLWNCVNRYVRKVQKNGVRVKGITLFLVNALGHPKEVSAVTLCS